MNRGGLFAQLFACLAPETQAQLRTLYGKIGPAEFAKLKTDVKGFVRADPVSGFLLAEGIVRDALQRHGVNVTQLALECVIRYLAED